MKSSHDAKEEFTDLAFDALYCIGYFAEFRLLDRLGLNCERGFCISDRKGNPVLGVRIYDTRRTPYWTWCMRDPVTLLRNEETMVDLVYAYVSEIS